MANPVVKRSYPSTLNKTALGMAASTVPSTTLFTELGRYTVVAGQGIMPGSGNKQGQDDATGRIYMDIGGVGPVDLEGLLRLDVHDALDFYIGSVGEWRTEQLRTSATVPAQQVPFPLQNIALKENYALVLKIKGDAATAITLADSTILISYTNMVVA